MTSGPDGMHLTVDAVLESGGTFSGSGTWRADGRDYPFQGIPGLDSIAMTRTSDRLQSGVAKLQGKPVMSVSFSVSDDDRVHTVYARAVDGAARPFENTLVFNRK